MEVTTSIEEDKQGNIERKKKNKTKTKISYKSQCSQREINKHTDREKDTIKKIEVDSQKRKGRM